MNHLSQHTQISAFTLIEVLVTLAITTIGLVGLSAMLIEANRMSQDSGNRSQAVWMVEDLTNRIRANREEFMSYDTGGSPVDCAATPATNCAAYFDGSSQVAAAACSNQELAEYDLWDVACNRTTTISGSDVVRNGATSFIANPELIVTIALSDITRQEIITITLSWDSRTGGTDKNGNRIYISDSSLVATEITTRRESIQSDFTP